MIDELKRMRILFISSFQAGICIAIGGTVYLLADNKVIGSFLFPIGLITICAFRFDLFTGKICYLGTDKNVYSIFDLILIWIGNFIGTVASASVLLCTRIGPRLSESARSICETKLNDSLLSLFILAVFCNILIYIAVEGFSNISGSAKYFVIIMSVSIFIICGFEHCIADIFYFALAMPSDINNRIIFVLLTVTLGNALGGISFNKYKCMIDKKKR